MTEFDRTRPSDFYRLKRPAAGEAARNWLLRLPLPATERTVAIAPAAVYTNPSIIYLTSEYCCGRNGHDENDQARRPSSAA